MTTSGNIDFYDVRFETEVSGLSNKERKKFRRPLAKTLFGRPLAGNGKAFREFEDTVHFNGTTLIVPERGIARP